MFALLFVVACGGDATATPGSIFPTAAPLPTATAAPTPTIPPTPPSPLLRLHLGGEPNTLDPQLASSLLEFSVLRQLSEGLLGFDEDLHLIPLVPTEVTAVQNGGISDDGLTYTFKLRDGLIWSGSQPLTAGDFVYTAEDISQGDRVLVIVSGDTTSGGPVDAVSVIVNPPEVGGAFGGDTSIGILNGAVGEAGGGGLTVAADSGETRVNLGDQVAVQIYETGTLEDISMGDRVLVINSTDDESGEPVTTTSIVINPSEGGGSGGGGFGGRRQRL